MKHLPYILANLWRKKGRLFLTLGSFAVALFLFALLAAIHNGFYQGIEAAGADRLITRNKISLIMFLPYAHKGRMEALEGVERVVPFIWFGGVYQDRRNFFSQMAIEPDHFLDVYPEYLVPPDQWQAFLQDRQGALVGKALMERFGWSLGDRIPLMGTIFPGTWEFNITAVYEGSRPNLDESGFFFHYRLLEESVPYVRGQVGWYGVQISDPEQYAEVVERIDSLFENSPAETKTEPEKLFMVGFAKQMGNIKLIILAVGGVVIFTLLLVTGSTMAISVRERTNEIGILKTLGFPDGLVLRIVLMESLVYAVVGGGLGLLLAAGFVSRGDPTGGMLPTFYLSTTDWILGVILIVVTGTLAGIIPSINAMKLRIVDALRRI